ncbi:hypothetical protein AAGR22_19045 [Erwinia sp. HDF1-3R]|uniref:T6SS immunity protein Tli3 family protein n=1 Tax=Erwinia sp. HDF1-3R TaxID=3141543 RepID=UPI0031F55104
MLMRKSGRVWLLAISLSLSLSLLTGCTGTFSLKKPQKPVQVVYRFDDHRWLELKGFNCEGELWFVDQKRGIRSQAMSQFYRIFTKPYINASERYIAVPGWSISAGVLVSKDYGRTWNRAPVNFKGEEDDGSDSPAYDNIKSLTVVNDQGFLLINQGHIYMSSLPFDDPRLEPGGPGIDYTITFRGREIAHHINAVRPGARSTWGLNYIDPRILHRLVDQYYTNFQNLPDKVPEVKNYRGWTKMQCDLNAGL